MIGMLTIQQVFASIMNHQKSDHFLANQPHPQPHPNILQTLTKDVAFGEGVDLVVGLTATALAADQLLRVKDSKQHKKMHLAKAGLSAAAAAAAASATSITRATAPGATHTITLAIALTRTAKIAVSVWGLPVHQTRFMTTGPRMGSDMIVGTTPSRHPEKSRQILPTIVTFRSPVRARTRSQHPSRVCL